MVSARQVGHAVLCQQRSVADAAGQAIAERIDRDLVVIRRVVKTATHDGTEVAGQADIRLALHEAATRAVAAGVAASDVGTRCAEAGFNIENGAQTAAQVFRALQADTGRRLDAGLQAGEAGGTRASRRLDAGVMGNAHVDDAVQLNAAVSSKSGAGEGADDGEGE